ncbi:hypothetical protein EEX84_13330, partial [Planococcus salinus]
FGFQGSSCLFKLLSFLTTFIILKHDSIPVNRFQKVFFKFFYFFINCVISPKFQASIAFLFYYVSPSMGKVTLIFFAASKTNTLKDFCFSFS